MNKDFLENDEGLISASRASQKFGYAQDHIGALIRSGKVKGKMIGRAWFVLEKSLEDHKNSRKQKNRKVALISESLEPRIIKAPKLPSLKYEHDNAPRLPELSKSKYRIQREVLLKDLVVGSGLVLSLVFAIALSSLSDFKIYSKQVSQNEGLISEAVYSGAKNASASLMSNVADNLQNLFDNFSVSDTKNSRNKIADITSFDNPSLFDQNICSPFIAVGKPELSTEPQVALGSNPPVKAVVTEYRSITEVTPLKLTLADVVKNGNQTLDDVLLMGNVSVGKNLSINGGLEVGSGLMARSASFVSAGVSGDFSAGGKVTLGNSKKDILIFSRNATLDKDGNVVFNGTVNEQAISDKANFTGTLNVLSGQTTLASLMVNGSTTVQDVAYTNATGTNATTTNIYSDKGVFGSIVTNTTLGVGTTSNATISIAQSSNGSTTLFVSRSTDTVPSGDFIIYKNHALDTTLFRVDNSGNLYAGGIINSGSQTITSTSQPQFRVQYDASNEITTNVNSAGITTLGVIGTTPRLVFTPQSNRSDTFRFTDSSSNSILNLDTTNLIATIANLLVNGSTTLQNFTFQNATGTSATTTNLYSANIVSATLKNSGSATFGNITSNGSTTLQNFTFQNATGTSATTTNFYTSGQTVLAGAGGKVGIGTTNPTNDLSLGNSVNRKIAVDNADSGTAGKNLTIAAGGVVPFVANTSFVAQNINTIQNWYGVTVGTNGDVYLDNNADDIYKQSGGVGNFNHLNQGGKNWSRMTTAPNGDVYATTEFGDIYKQTGGVGDFTGLGQSHIQWEGIAAAPNGNIYAAVWGGDIYMQTGGVGSFNPLGQSSRQWVGMASAPNGNIYASDYQGDIYMQTGGSGNFNALSQTHRAWTGVAVTPSGDVYATSVNDDIYKQTNGTGNFVALNQGAKSWEAIASDANSNVYAVVFGGDLYKLTNNSPSNLAGGNLILSSGVGSGSASSNISFLTGTTLNSGSALQTLAEKMTILGNGNVGIGTTNPQQQFVTTGSVALQGVGNGAGTAYLCLTLSTGVVSTSTTACNPSSIRFKTNVQDISYGLSDIMKLRPTAYDYKPEMLVPGHQIGFIAEEMNLVIPEVVGYDAQGLPANIDYAKLTPVLTRAIQELNINTTSFASTTTASLATITQSIIDQNLRIASLESKVTDLLNQASTTVLTLNQNGQRLSTLESLVSSTTVFNINASTTQSLVASVLAAIGGTIEGAVLHLTSLITDMITTKNITIKADDVAKTGITVYDRQTGEPVCMFVYNDLITSERGVCGTQSIVNNQLPNGGNGTSTPPQDGGGQNGTSTPPIDGGGVGGSGDTGSTTPITP